MKGLMMNFNIRMSMKTKFLILTFLIFNFSLSYGQGWWFASPAIKTTTLKDSLISVWELNETSGSNAADAHSSNNGSITGAVVGYSGVSGDGAYGFDGNDYIEIANESNFDGLSTVSISTWVNVSSFPSSNGLSTIVAKGYNGTNTESFYLRIYNDAGTSKLQFGTWNLSGGSIHASWNITGWSTGTWYHIIAIFNGNTYKLYFNNSEVASTTSSTAPYNTNQPVSIGAWKNGASTWDRYFNGYIDQTVISRACWTSTERSDLHNSVNILPYINW